MSVSPKTGKEGDRLETFDVLVIGSGPGGYIAAEEAARLGNSVGVVEKNAIGGCCLNVGCIPSKTYLHYSHWLASVEKAKQSGLKITIDDIDFPAIVSRKNKLVSTLQNGIHTTFKKNGIRYIEGEAKYVDKNTFDVNGQKYSGKRILLATGGSPFVPNIPGLKNARYLTTDTIFTMEQLPKKMVTIGGGVIGVELAFSLSRFGVDVTILEVAPDILLTIDDDAREIIKQKLESIGITIATNVQIQEVRRDMVVLAGEEKYPYDELFVATGRKANLELPTAMGLELDGKSEFVKVDEYYETSQKNVYAIGDLIGGYTLAHVASAEGIKVARAMSGKKERPIQPNSVPRPIFIDPEVSEFGLSEREAKEAGYDVIVQSMPFSFNGRAIVASETEGFVKIVTESRYHEILGAVVVGANAADLIHQILTVYKSEGTLDELTKTIFAHPTVSELIQDTAKNALKNN